MVCLEEGIPEGILKPEELLPVYFSDEIRCRFLCIVQDSQDQLLVGKEQVSEDIKRGMRNLICFADFFYGVGMQEVSF